MFKFSINNLLNNYTNLFYRFVYDNNILYDSELDSYIGSNLTLKVAITVHVFHLDMMPNVLGYLRNIPSPFHIFFTVSKENESQLLDYLETYSTDRYTIINHSNQGYDISPFLSLIPILKKRKYDIVCKIHTKKGPDDFGVYKNWFDYITEPILGSKRTVLNILTAFEENDDLGVVGASNFYKSAKDLMYDNDKSVRDVLYAIDQKFDFEQNWGFFAGTIFWSKVSLFDPFLNNLSFNTLLEDCVNDKMQSGKPASFFHALERVFGALPKIANMKVALSYPTNVERNGFAIKVLSHSSSGYNKTGMYRTLTDIENSINDLD